MAEMSFPWTDGVGDGGPYSADAYDTFEHYTMTEGGANEGVLRGLRVSGTASPLSVAVGAAIVNGKRYVATAPVSVSVPTPASATRIDRIVLQSDWNTRTVRIARLAGTEGSGTPPALTQTDGVKWEIPLAKITITTAGSITVVDERVMTGPRANNVLVGTIIMWSGNLDGHYPVNPRTGTADTRWHICNGDVERGVQTPDLRDRFIVAEGTIYARGTTGGTDNLDLAHTHGAGTLAAASAGGHSHDVGTLAAASESAHTHGPGSLATNAVQAGNHNHSISSGGYHDHSLTVTPGGAPGNDYIVTGVQSDGDHNHGGLTGSSNPTAHSHSVATGVTDAGSAHTHTLAGSTASVANHAHSVTGTSASALADNMSIVPPYYALAFLCYVGD